MKHSLLALTTLLALAAASGACGSSPVDADTTVAEQGNLVEGEQVLSRILESVPSKRSDATRVGNWDMLAIRHEGREYTVFVGYDSRGKAPENAVLEMVFEKQAEGVRIEPRTPDGKPLTLEKNQSIAILADIEGMLSDAGLDALPAGATVKGCAPRVSVPRKALLVAVRVISGLGCTMALFVPFIGVPSCVVWAAAMINPFDMEMVKPEGCD